MSRYVARKFTLALSLLLLIAPATRAFAYDCPPNPAIPCVVGGGNPDPQVVVSPLPSSPVVTGAKSSPQIVLGDLRLIAVLEME